MSDTTDTYGFEAELEDGVITLCDSMGGGTRIFVRDCKIAEEIAAHIKSCADTIAEEMIEQLGLNDDDDEEHLR